MSIHNYKEASGKTWADIKCDDLEARTLNASVLLTADGLNVTNTANVQNLNISGFVIGAIDSVNNYVPVISNQTGAFLGKTITLEGGYAQKINNIVKCQLIFTTDTLIAADGSFKINNLPIPKTSNFTLLDRGFGMGSSVSPLAKVRSFTVLDDLPAASQDITCYVDSMTAETQTICIDFTYTTN